MTRGGGGDRTEQSAKPSGNAAVTQVARDYVVYNGPVTAAGDHDESIGTGLLRPITELDDPFDLEVHRAIDVEDAAGAASPGLPTYVPRDPHDSALAAVVAEAAAGRSGIAVLVGGSSTGKTRACWEAVRAPGALPEGWRLWHPIYPSPPRALLAGLPKVEPRTVVWLNEAQSYLHTSATDLGEQAAAGLRELLRDPRRAPVLVLGTMWPEFFHTLATADRSPESTARHSQARALLSGHEIYVPDSFTGRALDDLRAAARTDPRLALASQKAEHGEVTQFLAGAPELLRRYRGASPQARALIHVAMDARRLGHGPVLARDLLTAAAPDYLTDPEWDRLAENWIDPALAYCTEPCLGVRGPLSRVHERPGQGEHETSADRPRYRLADYLDQIGLRGRDDGQIPASLWNALVEHAAEGDRHELALAAERRGLYRHAVPLYAAANTPRSLLNEGDLLKRMGQLDDALAAYRAGGEAGGPLAYRRAAELLVETGRLDEALVYYRHACDAGDMLAMSGAGRALLAAGRTQEAAEWLRRAAESGDINSLQKAAKLIEEAGRTQEAAEWLTALAARSGEQVPGDAVQAFEARQFRERALHATAWLFNRTGRIDEAVALLRRASAAGEFEGMSTASHMLHKAGRIDEALQCLEDAVELSGPSLLQEKARLLTDLGRVDEAIECYKRAHAVGITDCAMSIGDLLGDQGQVDEALEWYEKAAARVFSARSAAGRLLAKAGRVDEALDWFRRAADAGDVNVLAEAGSVLLAVGRGAEATTWLTSLLELTGDPAEARDAAYTLGRGFTTRSPKFDEEPMRVLGDLLREADPIDGLLAWFVRAARAEMLPSPILAFAGFAMYFADRTDEAIAWLESLVDAGEKGALGAASLLMRHAGRTGEREQPAWFDPDADVSLHSIVIGDGADFIPLDSGDD